MNLYTRRISHY